MNNRTKIAAVTSLIIGLLFMVFSVFMISPLFRESQSGTFTVASCAIERIGGRNTGFCYGAFAPDSGEPINSNPSSSVEENTPYDSGTVLSARLYKDGTVVTDSTALIFSALRIGALGVFFAVIGAVLLIVSRRHLPPGKTALGQTVTGQGLPALTQNVSVWSHIAFFSSIGCILLLPGPIALISGIAGVVDSYKNNKKGVWRAWVGIVVGFVATVLLIFVGAQFLE